MRFFVLLLLLVACVAASANGQEGSRGEGEQSVARPEWSRFENPEYSVTFPGREKELLIRESDGAGTIEIFSGGANFGVVTQTLPTPAEARYVDNTYNRLSAAMVNSKATKLIKMGPVRKNGIVGREIVLEQEGLRIYGRIFISGTRVYIVSVNIRSETYSPDFERSVDRFFGSFFIKPTDRLTAGSYFRLPDATDRFALPHRRRKI